MYLDSSIMFEIYKLGVFIIIIIFIFVGVWNPYLNSLSLKIWKTKGMLNMIPMEFIKKNPILEEHILSKDILNSIK